MTFGLIVRRALAAGLFAGIALGGYMWLVVEPVVDEAIALEEELAAVGRGSDGLGDTDHEHGDEAMFTRSTQVVGGIAASVIYSVVFGGVFGMVYSAVRHRLPMSTDFGRVVWLSSVAFGALAVIPALKYPANPPAVGDPDTVNERTVQYLILVALSLALVWWVSRLSRQLRARLEDRDRIVIVAVTAVAAFGALVLVLPASPDAIDPAVPASLIWDFRIRSLGGLTLFWASFGLSLGWLLDRVANHEATAGPDVAARSYA